MAERVLADLATYRGRAIEPVVREALTRMLTDARFGSARHVGAYWTRDGRVEVDLLGGTRPERAEVVEFVGSIKWRDKAPFDTRDLVALAVAGAGSPGAEAGAGLVGVSRSGFATGELAVALDPRRPPSPPGKGVVLAPGNRARVRAIPLRVKRLPLCV